MTDKIPDDVMEAALDIVGIIREHKNCEEEYNTFQIRYREAIDIVARAILSERESATKAIIAKIERAISNAKADAILRNHPQERQGVLTTLGVLLGSLKAEISATSGRKGGQ